MADILIKGMEMPKKGEHATITVYFDGVWCAHFDNEPHGKAVPLPEKHGRLIDAEAFVDYMQNRYDNNEITNGDWIGFRLALKDQPTIVPADGGGKDGQR